MIPRRKLKPGELDRLPDVLRSTVAVPLPNPQSYTAAVLAVRISRDRDARLTSTSVLDQDEGVTAHADSQGLLVVDTVVDRGVSARYIPPWSRPDLGPYFRDPSLLATWDTLVFLKIDRFFRSTADLALMTIWLDATGRRLLCVRDTLDLSTTMGRQMAMMQVGYAQAEAETIGSRVKDTQTGLKKRGLRASGGVPFGHRAVPSTRYPGKSEWEPHPKWSLIVASGMDAFVSGQPGVTLTSIARDWDEAGVPSSKDSVILDAGGNPLDRENAQYGHGWSYKSLKVVFSNPIHIGLYYINGIPQLDEKGNILTRSKPIVSVETFNKVQAKLAIKQDYSPRENGTDLLGVALCPDCWCSLYRNVTKSKGRVYVYYVCVTPKCPNAGCREEYLFALVNDFVLLDRYADLPRMERAFTPGNDVDAELSAVEALIQGIRDERDAGLYLGDDAGYMARLTGYVERRTALQAQPRVSGEVRYTDTGQTVRDWWESLDWAGRGAWLRRCGVTVWLRRPARGVPEVLVHAGGTWDALMRAAQGEV